MASIRILLLSALAFSPVFSSAGDWPMWRYDSNRGASSPDSLPENLHLQWTRQLPEPIPAWPREQTKLLFDLKSEPVVMGQRIFTPSNRNDSVTAYDTRSGKELWRFYADGPVRFAPVAHRGKVFFTSDDGFLYCVSAENGQLIWKVNGGPGERRILGNHRLVSSWPARGGVVLHRDRLFFAASIWPFMGIFIHAVDPESGEILWTNSGDGSNYTIQPHNAPSFAGLVPQGHLAADGDSLVVPGGRSTPGIYDIATGRQLLFNYDKRAGGHDVGIVGDLLFTAGHAFSSEKGNPIGGGAPAIFDNETLIASDPKSLFGRHAKVEVKTKKKKDRRGKTIEESSIEFRDKFRTSLKNPIPGQWFLRAGQRYYAGGDGKVAAYEEGKDEPVWESSLEGKVVSMLAGDDRLFVITGDNRLHCFGSAKPDRVARHDFNPDIPTKTDDQWMTLAAKILKRQGTGEGFAVVMGIGSGRLIEELLRNSKLHIIAIDPDPEKVRAFRDSMTAANWYGKRCAAILDDPFSANLPPYLANLIIVEKPTLTDAQSKIVFSALRPYGGTAVLGDGLTFLVREGALPNSDDWTHQYANAAQTVVSSDDHVKAPFGVLWFGGPSHEGILPRHGHGPSPQVAGGRLFIEGPDMLRAVDVYTGRLLWERELKGLGSYYNTTAHFPGAGEIGSNYVSLPDRLYVVYGDKIHQLNPRDGATQREFSLPPPKPGMASPFWGHVAVSGDFLIATSSPVLTKGSASGKDKPPEKTIIPKKAKWDYLATDKKIASWTALDFEKTKDWKTGAAGFGYGDGDDATVIDMKNKVARLLIRREFEAKEIPENAGDLILRIRFDDAFIAYLNGREFARSSVVTKRDGSVSVGSHEADKAEDFRIKDWRERIREGKNILAIEGFNRSKGSSDFTLDPILVAPLKNPESVPPVTEIPTTRYSSGSRRLVVFDRQTGEQLWSREARFNFRHNNIAASGDRLFCIDSMTNQRAQSLARRGIQLSGKPALYSFDLKTGRVIWEKHEGVFGTFLNYSAEHDVLVQGGSAYRDRAADEVRKGLIALRGTTGEILWHQPDLEYSGPCLLWRDQIVTNGTSGFSLDLKTGEETGWKYSRMYGCNTAVGSKHLMTFRSGAAGFFDLANNSGTGNLGGFKSSCTNNLIPANGVLNAPDYTRTCSCSYQNQTSLALIHMPEAEFWTFGGQSNPDRIGINFGAPGDRRSAEGTLFCEFPEVGGSSDSAKVKVEGKGDPKYSRIHASLMDGPATWIGASAVEGVSKIDVDLPENLRNRDARVRIYFSEPDKTTKKGDRIFDVSLNGKVVLSGLDIVAEAGTRKCLIKEIASGEKYGKDLELEFVARRGRPVCCGLEVVKR